MTNGTPKDLRGAIENGLEASRLRVNRAEIIHQHIRDFLAQRFQTAMLLSKNDEETDTLSKLFTEIIRPYQKPDGTPGSDEDTPIL